MNKNELTISIPKPCKQDWNAMTADKSGKFCASCQKTVIDFSRMSDAEIVHYLSNFKGTPCGRFSVQQLNRPLVEPFIAKPKNRWAWALSVLLLPTVAASQPPIPMEPTEILDPSVSEQKKQSNSEEKANIKDGVITLKGIVWDDHYELLRTASIVLKGTTKGVPTDQNGRFELVLDVVEIANKPFEITISYVGYETQTLLINPSKATQDLIITLKTGKYIMSEVIYVKPNFLKRIKYRIQRFFGK